MNRGIIWIGHETIAQLLELPEGQRVITVAADWQRMSIGVAVEGEGLPDVDESAESPTVPLGPYVDLSLREKVRALLDRYWDERDGPDSGDFAAKLEQVLTRELDPRIDMPEELKP